MIALDIVHLFGHKDMHVIFFFSGQTSNTPHIIHNNKNIDKKGEIKCNKQHRHIVSHKKNIDTYENNAKNVGTS